MGSFLTKCFVTQQTVFEKAECVVFPIVRYKSKVEVTKGGQTIFVDNNRSVFSTKLINKFLGLKIDAIAQDCASQSLIDSEFNRESVLEFFSFLYKNSFESKESDRRSFSFKELLKAKSPTILQYLHLPVKESSDFNIQTIPFNEISALWEDIQEADRDNLILVTTSGSNEPHILNLSVCLKTTYEYCIKMQPKAHFPNLSEISIESIKEFVEERKQLLTKHPVFIVGELEPNKEYRQQSLYLNYLYKVFNRFNDFSKPIDPAKILKTLKSLTPLTDFLRFQSEIEELSLIPIPIQYGCQDYQNEYGDRFLKMVKYVNTECSKLIEREDEE